MPPWMREAVNYFVYYLAQGQLTPEEIEARFEASHGSITGLDFDAILRAANYAVANATAVIQSGPRKILRNALKGIPPGQQTVEIRALCTGQYSNGAVETAMVSGVFSVNDRVADVDAFFAQACPINQSLAGAVSVSYQIIPGIYLPGIGE